jgi:DNA-binding NarL/FixJ family response regulator
MVGDIVRPYTGASLATIKVFLIDEQQIMRKGMRTALEQEPAIVVVGEAADVLAALTPLGETLPDVVILGTAQRNCVDMVRTILFNHRALRVVLLATQEEPDALIQALRAGCHGLLLRRSSASTLVDAVRAVKAGGTFLCDEAGDIVMQGFERQRSSAGAIDPLQYLSVRERQVLNLTVDGLTSGEIAQQLAISPKSVDTYRGRLMAKIGVRHASELLSFAQERGLAQHPSR